MASLGYRWLVTCHFAYSCCLQEPVADVQGAHTLQTSSPPVPAPSPIGLHAQNEVQGQSRVHVSSLGDWQGCLGFPSLSHPAQLPLPQLHQTPSGQVSKHTGWSQASTPLPGQVPHWEHPLFPSQVNSPANTWLQAHTLLGAFPDLLGPTSSPLSHLLPIPCLPSGRQLCAVLRAAFWGLRMC